MKRSLTIHKRSHGFVVTGFNDEEEKAIRGFASTLIQWGMAKRGGSFRRAPLKVFASSPSDRSEYRFHIGHYLPFVRHLTAQGYPIKDFNVIEEEIKRGKDAPIKIKSSWKPRDHQHAAIDYVKRTPPPHLKILEMRPGSGKSFMAMYATKELGKRVLYIMRPAYMDKWLIDFQKTYVKGETEEKTLFVKGSASLKALLQMQHDQTLKASNIVISNKTFQMWLKDYELYKDNITDHGWVVGPDKFTEYLEIDTLVFDEVHQDFHLNFKIMSYCHVYQSLSLSATLVTHDKQLGEIYNLVHPPHTRYVDKAIERYTIASAYMYQFSEPEKIRFTEHGRKEYSHHAFERSIMRNDRVFSNYFDMINDVLETDFLKIRRPEQSALIFCASIKMCKLLSEWLQEKYPDEKVAYYVQGGDYDKDFIESTILVTTLGKSGTAVDKPNLRTVIMTNALDALAANIQALGRLRKLANGDTPRFIYFVNSDNDRHVGYHKRKLTYYHKYVKGDVRIRYHGKII